MTETIGAFVMEQTMEPQKFNIIHVENSPGLKFVRFEACLQTFNTWNRNNRNYFLRPMQETWAAPHVKELIKMGDFFGENGHPNSEDPKRIVTIDPKVCCHRIIDYRFEGNAVYGTVETLNDDLYGRQFMGHILQNCKGAFSLRALVPLTKIDAVRCEIRAKGHLIAEDRVILPSHKEAYQKSGPVEMVVGESYNPIPPGQINENKTVYVNESSSFIEPIKDYVKEQSFNLKTIVDRFEVAYESMNISKDGKHIALKEATGSDGIQRTAIIKTDDYLQKEVSSIFNSLGMY